MARSYGFKRNVAVVGFVMLGLVLLSVIVMIAVGVAVAIPYGKTKHFSETTASCTVVRVNRSGMISCSTTNDMDNTQTSKYPCLIISVNYTDLETGEIITNSPLYAGPYNYESLKEDGCSVFSCVTDKDDNAEKVAEFERKYGNIGQTFPCHPGSRADPEALLSVIPLWHVLLGLLLPSSVFFVALTLSVLYCICCVM